MGCFLPKTESPSLASESGNKQIINEISFFIQSYRCLLGYICIVVLASEFQEQAIFFENVHREISNF